MLVGRLQPATYCGDLNFNTKLVKATFVPVARIGKWAARCRKTEPAVAHGIVSAVLRSWFNAAASRRNNAPDGGKTRGEGPMQAMSAGVTRAGTGIDGIGWNILGQTY